MRMYRLVDDSSTFHKLRTAISNYVPHLPFLGASVQQQLTKGKDAAQELKRIKAQGQQVQQQLAEAQQRAAAA
jgi:hypothetical protein